MIGLTRELQQLDKEGTSIQVGIVGIGQMGEGLVCQMEQMKGIQAVALADIELTRCRSVLHSLGIPAAKIAEVTEIDKAEQAIHNNQRVITMDADLLVHLDLDIIVEASGIPEIGTKIAYDAILAGKHVLQMNVEADATVGYLLHKMAAAAGVVYTLTAGDEPGAIMELYEFAHSLGFTIICAGKGKNNPLDIHATPQTVEKKARDQNMNPKMLASFVDGTKTMVEMTSLGNGIGFAPNVRGLVGPQVTPANIAEVFVPEKDGGVLTTTQVVEYGVGIAPGVFVVFTTEQEKIRRDLQYLRLGPGPYWALYRPYHLANLETPISIARAVLHGIPTLSTSCPPVAETVAYAKRILKPGRVIDSLGGFDVYGKIEPATAKGVLPIGLAPGSRIIRQIDMDRPITYDDVELNEETYIVMLRKLQDKMVYAEG